MHAAVRAQVDEREKSLILATVQLMNKKKEAPYDSSLSRRVKVATSEPIYLPGLAVNVNRK